MYVDFPSHIWPSQQQNLAPLTIQERVIGHKSFGLSYSFQHGMTTLGDGQDIAVIECGATVLPCHRDFCQGGQHIKLTEYLSHALETPGVLGKLLMESS